MTRKSDQTFLGDLGFKGPAREKAVEIGYGVLPEYEGMGYTTEAVTAMAQWAFGSAGVVFVEAETEPDNRASQRVLEKCGFVPDGEGREGPRFVLESPLTSWMTIYMLFGLSIGTALGSASGSIGTGVSLGLCIGLCLGTALDASAKKARKKLLEQRKAAREESSSGKNGYQQISGEEAAQIMDREENYILLDVRTREEYENEHIPGAICIPNETIGAEEIPELPDKGQLILVYCRSGNRSKQAAEKLAALGYTNIMEFGGIMDWTGDTVTGGE